MRRIGLLLIVVMLLACGCESNRTLVKAAGPRPRDMRLAMEKTTQAVGLIKDGHYERAEELLDEAVEADPFAGIAHNNLGLVYYHQGRLYEAARAFQHAAKLLPYHPEPANNLGMVYESAGKLDDAVDQYETAYELQADNPALLGNLVRARLRRGDDRSNMRDQLTELVMKETRPEWLEWAKRQLGLAAETAEP